MKSPSASRNWRFLILFIFIGFTNYISAQNKTAGIHGLYRLINEVKDGFEICIVDGPLIRQKIYPEFLYGGNEQRYLFNPKHAVSYTHLRAHETDSYIVCRL